MPTILVIGDKVFRIEDSVEKKLLEWTQAPRTASEVSPEVSEKASKHLRDLNDIVFPPKKRGSYSVPSEGSKSKADTKTSEAKFQMAEDDEDSSPKS